MHLMVFLNLQPIQKVNLQLVQLHFMPFVNLQLIQLVNLLLRVQ